MEGQPTSESNSLIGRALGPYVLEARIGGGGMGVVYRAMHGVLGQARAIKILPPDLAADDNVVERFRREATIAAGLRHPNIVLIYDVAEQDGLHYIVMELVEGRSLRQILVPKRPMRISWVLGVLGQLAEALDYAHQRGVIHRDVKPANVLVGANDRVTLLDFGIARAAEASRLTRPGFMVGTPEYLAPELATGAEAGRGADLYALGIVAYELLTGQPPFVGKNPSAIIYAHVRTPPPSPRAARPDLSERVEGILLRQLAKDPAERFPSAGSFVEALRADETADLATIRGLPPIHPPTPSQEPAPEPAATPVVPPSSDSGPTVRPTTPAGGTPEKSRSSLRRFLLGPGLAILAVLAVVAIAVYGLNGPATGTSPTAAEARATPTPVAAAPVAATTVPEPAATAAPSLASTLEPTGPPAAAPTAPPPATAGPTAVPSPTAIVSLATAAVPPAAAAPPPTTATTVAAGAASSAGPARSPEPRPPTLTPAPQLSLRTVLDERFADNQRSWPSSLQGTARVEAGVYRLFVRQPGRFVSVGAPLPDSFGDVVVSSTCRKAGGPPGGGYGLIVRDAGPPPRDGVNQGGRYYVFEIGEGTQWGAWRREQDHWDELAPFTQSDAVRTPGQNNELTVRAIGRRFTFLANGTPLATLEDGALEAGKVGIYVAGDGNEVACERFAIEVPG